MRTHHHKHATPAHSNPTGPTTTLTPGVTAGDKASNSRPVTADDVRLCAYRKWDSAGKPPGDGVQFWLEAEQEVTQGE